MVPSRPGVLHTLSGRCRFRRTERLLTSADFLRVKRNGKRFWTTAFGVNAAPNGLQHHRLGLVVQKRFWNAVTRNRIKRRVRECFRLNKHLIPPPAKDIVVIARPGAERLKPQQIAKVILDALARMEGRRS